MEIVKILAVLNFKSINIKNNDENLFSIQDGYLKDG